MTIPACIPYLSTLLINFWKSRNWSMVFFPTVSNSTQPPRPASQPGVHSTYRLKHRDPPTTIIMIRLDLLFLLHLLILFYRSMLSRRRSARCCRLLIEFKIRELRGNAIGGFFLPVGTLGWRDGRCCCAGGCACGCSCSCIGGIVGFGVGERLLKRGGHHRVRWK